MYLWLLVLDSLYFITDRRIVLISNQVDGWQENAFIFISIESQDILSSFALIDFLSVALIKIAVLQDNSLACNEVSINQPSVKYSNFIAVQNDYGLSFVPPRGWYNVCITVKNVMTYESLIKNWF